MRARPSPHLKFDLCVNTDDTTQHPEGMKRFITPMSLSGESRATSQENAKQPEGVGRVKWFGLL